MSRRPKPDAEWRRYLTPEEAVQLARLDAAIASAQAASAALSAERRTITERAKNRWQYARRQRCLERT